MPELERGQVVNEIATVFWILIEDQATSDVRFAYVFPSRDSIDEPIGLLASGDIVRAYQVVTPRLSSISAKTAVPPTDPNGFHNLARLGELLFSAMQR